MNRSSAQQEEGRVGDRWRALALLAVTLVLSMSTWFSASAVIPQLRGEWGLSDEERGYGGSADDVHGTPGGGGARKSGLPETRVSS